MKLFSVQPAKICVPIQLKKNPINVLTHFRFDLLIWSVTEDHKTERYWKKKLKEKFQVSIGQEALNEKEKHHRNIFVFLVSSASSYSRLKLFESESLSKKTYFVVSKKSFEGWKRQKIFVPVFKAVQRILTRIYVNIVSEKCASIFFLLTSSPSRTQKILYHIDACRRILKSVFIRSILSFHP